MYVTLARAQPLMSVDVVVYCVPMVYECSWFIADIEDIVEPVVDIPVSALIFSTRSLFSFLEKEYSRRLIDGSLICEQVRRWCWVESGCNECDADSVPPAVAWFCGRGLSRGRLDGGGLAL